MKTILAAVFVALVSVFAFGDVASAQYPNRVYTQGWPVHGVYIHGNSIQGTYIAPPSAVTYDYRPQPYGYSWNRTFTYPNYGTTNVSSGYPTRYDWRWYGR